MARFGTWLLGAVAVAAVAGCGGGGSKTSSAAGSATSSAKAPATSTAGSATSGAAGAAGSGSSPSAKSAGPSVTTGPVRATLHGQNHAPKAGKPWHYVLTVHSPDGKPLSGSVAVQFVLGPMVVGRDRPPVHPLRHGRLRESLTFPPAAAGHPIALETVVHTSAGSATCRWPVMVSR